VTPGPAGHVLAAPDKFRGTAAAGEVAEAIARAVAELGGTAERLPLADGGEGTVDALGGANRWTTVTGPVGSPVVAGWRMGEDGEAVIERPAASGLMLAGGAEGNDPWNASTRGTGELIRAATDEGARRIIVGLGGSATTDGGAGALQVLAAHPLWDAAVPHPRRPELVVCCDVNTSFVDAAPVFAPQKGADPELVARLRERLAGLAARYAQKFGVEVTTLAGSGAAGGLAGGLAVLGATLLPGFEVVAQAAGLDAALARADLVITGEGCLDAGSFDGKVVGGVLSRALAQGRPVVAVVGTCRCEPPPGLAVLDLVERFGPVHAVERTTECIRAAVLDHLSTTS
jgi:glycerate 2-kinase